MRDIFHDMVALGMSLGVARPSYTKIPLVFDIAYQLMGVSKVSGNIFLRDVFGDIPPQGQNIFYSGLLHAPYLLLYVLFRGRYTGKVGYDGHTVGILYVLCYVGRIL